MTYKHRLVSKISAQSAGPQTTAAPHRGVKSRRKPKTPCGFFLWNCGRQNLPAPMPKNHAGSGGPFLRHGSGSNIRTEGLRQRKTKPQRRLPGPGAATRRLSFRADHPALSARRNPHIPTSNLCFYCIIADGRIPVNGGKRFHPALKRHEHCDTISAERIWYSLAVKRRLPHSVEPLAILRIISAARLRL